MSGPMTTTGSRPRSPPYRPACGSACTSSATVQPVPPRSARPGRRRAQGGVQHRGPTAGTRPNLAGHRPPGADRPEGPPGCSRAREELIASTSSFASTGLSCAQRTRLSASTKEIGRLTDVVGIFPNDAAVIRLAAALLSEPTTDGSSSAHLSVESIRIAAASPSMINSPEATTMRPRCCLSHPAPRPTATDKQNQQPEASHGAGFSRKCPQRPVHGVRMRIVGEAARQQIVRSEVALRSAQACVTGFAKYCPSEVVVVSGADQLGGEHRDDEQSGKDRSARWRRRGRGAPLVPSSS